MPDWSQIATLAFGALMGALLMAMIISDDSAKMAEAIKGMAQVMRDDMVMLPVSKAERKK